jgi:hypothetical protein
MEGLSFSWPILAGLLLMGFALGLRLADIFVLWLDELYSWARQETITCMSWGRWKLSHMVCQSLTVVVRYFLRSIEP